MSKVLLLIYIMDEINYSAITGKIKTDFDYFYLSRFQFENEAFSKQKIKVRSAQIGVAHTNETEI